MLIPYLAFSFSPPAPSNPQFNEIQAKLQQANEGKSVTMDVSSLQQEENVSISGSNARLMIMKKLSRKSEVFCPFSLSLSFRVIILVYTHIVKQSHTHAHPLIHTLTHTHKLSTNSLSSPLKYTPKFSERCACTLHVFSCEHTYVYMYSLECWSFITW